MKDDRLLSRVTGPKYTNKMLNIEKVIRTRKFSKKFLLFNTHNKTPIIEDKIAIKNALKNNTPFVNFVYINITLSIIAVVIIRHKKYCNNFFIIIYPLTLYVKIN